MTRRPLLAGNWKMHGTLARTRELIAALRAHDAPTDVELAIFPPFTALAAAGEALRGSSIALGAQTMHDAPDGAHTGEISAPMLLELGVRYVILGHSERRADDGETDASIARKVRAALAAGIAPIVAVGETHAEHLAGLAHDRVVAQTRAALGDLGPSDLARCVLAYEPIWAIGSGTSCAPDVANAVTATIRSALPGLAATRILYGGSMKPENAAELFAQPEIDGGLVGGASLDAEAFLAIARAARARVGAER